MITAKNHRWGPPVRKCIRVSVDVLSVSEIMSFSPPAVAMKKIGGGKGEAPIAPCSGPAAAAYMTVYWMRIVM